MPSGRPATGSAPFDDVGAESPPPEILRTFRDSDNAGDDAHKTKGKLVDKIVELLTAKATVLIESVRHHIEEEEEDWFPQSARHSDARPSRRSVPRWSR